MIDAWTILFRLVLAAVLSGVIGFEREFHGRAAGFRTHILLCVGSTLVMLTSMHIFDLYYGKVPVDPARIAAGVITGIGFLGAGTIMHSRSSVRGLTTAASLWVVAGLGLAVGSGLYFGSAVTAVITIITLMFFSRLEHVMIRKDWYKTIYVEAKEGTDRIKAIRSALVHHGVDITDFEADRTTDGSHMALRIGLRLHSVKTAGQILSDVGNVDGVKYVKWEVD
jgi:putative Mg2+ transporter-C (MgtC) family protein